MLSELSYSEAVEWELFSNQNPDQLDTISVQLAQIAVFFANAFAQKKDKTSWDVQMFLPKFGNAEDKKKKPQAQISDSALSLAGIFGDDKTRKKVSEHFNEGVIGKDGKKYKYALEETAPQRKTLPKRLRG